MKRYFLAAKAENCMELNNFLEQLEHDDTQYDIKDSGFI